MGQIVFQATLGGQVAVAGPNTASSFTLTLPAATDTLVGKATTDTLTNKTLTSPTITGATLTTSAFNGTVGATTASTGAFTSVTTTSITNSGLTSGRVTFAGASGLLSDSANLQFNGTNLGVGATPSAWNAVFRVLNLHDSFNIYGQTNDPASGGLTANSYFGTSSFLYKSNGFATHYTQTDGTHKWLTAPSGTAGNAVTFTEAMRITNAGLVGIGTSSPNALLEVYGGDIRLRSTSNGANGFLTFVNTSGGVASSIYNYNGLLSLNEQLIINNSTGNVGIGTSSPDTTTLLTVAGAVTITGANSGHGASRLKLGQDTSAISQIRFYGANASTAGILQFTGSSSDGTVGSERMRIDASGNLLVGTTSALAKFVVDGTAYISSITGIASTRTTGKLNIDANINSENGIDIQSLQSPANGSFIIFRNSSGAVAGSITHISSTAVLYNTTSDQRVKTNIIDAPSGNIDSIKVRSFDWIEDGSHQEYGMVAQELLEVAPYAVHQPQNSDEMMGVDYSKLVPMMIKEIQDLKQRIATLENK